MGQSTGATGVRTITTKRYPRIPGVSGPTPIRAAGRGSVGHRGSSAREIETNHKGAATDAVSTGSWAIEVAMGEVFAGRTPREEGVGR